MDPHPGVELPNVKSEKDGVCELGSPRVLKNSPQEPKNPEDRPQGPRESTENSPWEPEKPFRACDQEPRYPLEDSTEELTQPSAQEPRCPREDCPQEPRSPLEYSLQEPRSPCEDNPQKPQPPLEYSRQEPKDPLEESHLDPKSPLQDSPREPGSPSLEEGSSQDSLEEDSSQEPRSPLEEDGEDDGHSPESTQNNQIVLYNHGEESHEEIHRVSTSSKNEDLLPRFATSTPTTKILPSVGAFTVQCARCFKWRLIPTKEKYEEIRAHIMEIPFVCETATEWRSGISCDDPADINQDGTRLWAIDKPSIALPPPGWQRLLRIRGEGSTRFADVYYLAPSGKKLRSMVEIDKYLLEHPEYVAAGVNRSQFSFQIPRPLQENYVRKRPASRLSYDGSNRLQGRLESAPVKPLAWAGPASDPYRDPPVLEPLHRPTKKRTARSPKEKMYSTNSVCSYEL